MGTNLERFAALPCVYVGTVSRDMVVPLVAFRGGPGALRKVALTSETSASVNATDYWQFMVEVRPTSSSTPVGGGGTFSTAVYGLAAGIWTDLTERVRMESDQTVQVRILKRGNPADLSGVAFSFVQEVR
jgi:hypothetical protein